jgi:hypothetical protein
MNINRRAMALTLLIEAPRTGARHIQLILVNSNLVHNKTADINYITRYTVVTLWRCHQYSWIEDKGIEMNDNLRHSNIFFFS